MWDPYKELRAFDPKTRYVTFYEGMIRCLHIKVAHLPSRVLRQFGAKQRCPGPPPESHGDNFNDWISHSLLYFQRRTLKEGEPSCEEGYLNWYFGRSHPLLQNPNQWKGPTTVTNQGRNAPYVDTVKSIYFAFM